MFWHHEKGQKTGYEDAIVVGKAVRIPWSGWRKFYVIGCVVLVVAAAISSIFSLRANNRAHRAEKAISAQLDTQEYSNLQSGAKNESARGQYAQAAKHWVTYAKKTPDKTHRAKAWQNAGLLYMSTADYAKALDCFRTSEATDGLTYVLATEIAAAASRAGNTPVAITYLRDAIRLMPKDIPAAGEQKQLFTQEIDQLQQGKT